MRRSSSSTPSRPKATRSLGSSLHSRANSSVRLRTRPVRIFGRRMEEREGVACCACWSSRLLCVVAEPLVAVDVACQSYLALHRNSILHELARVEGRPPKPAFVDGSELLARYPPQHLRARLLSRSQRARSASMRRELETSDCRRTSFRFDGCSASYRLVRVHSLVSTDERTNRWKVEIGRGVMTDRDDSNRGIPVRLSEASISAHVGKQQGDEFTHVEQISARRSQGEVCCGPSLSASDARQCFAQGRRTEVVL